LSGVVNAWQIPWKYDTFLAFNWLRRTRVKPTLIVLAAGMGSRYGGLKQMDGVGPLGETIVDYSLYDALRAGFGKVVFIIRRDIEADFREVFLARLSGKIDVQYVFQELTDLPAGFSCPPDRQKPWGTSHAVLSAASRVCEPFAVINADDFYGRAGFRAVADFLKGAGPSQYAIVGYGLRSTLSEHGSVARGVCEVDDAGYMSGIVERIHIEKLSAGIFYKHADGRLSELPESTIVSMNFWGFMPDYFERARREFVHFLRQNIQNPKSEMFIPLVVNTLIKSGEATVKVLPTPDQWFGVTYREDRPRVMAELEKLVAAGEYPRSLWG
jgi:NDP-sugar pyrophosphorylase family protein